MKRTGIAECGFAAELSGADVNIGAPSTEMALRVGRQLFAGSADILSALGERPFTYAHGMRLTGRAARLPAAELPGADVDIGAPSTDPRAAYRAAFTWSHTLVYFARSGPRSSMTSHLACSSAGMVTAGFLRNSGLTLASAGLLGQ